MSRTPPPHGLAQLQRWMAAVIFERGRLDHADTGGDLDRWIAMPARGRAHRRLGAYVGGYPVRIHDALCEAFPALRHVVGQRAFGELAERYRPVVPAGGYSLADVGGNLAEFVSRDDLGMRFPFAADLAGLEWAVRRAFHATLAPPLDPTPLASWGPDQWSRAALGFQPGVAVIASRWPILDVWHARETPVEEIDVDLVDRSQNAVVHRSGDRVVCRTAAAGEEVVLASLLDGAMLGETMERLEAPVADDTAIEAGDVMGWFAGWMRDGLIVECRAV